jgi:hypothetical protein
MPVTHAMPKQQSIITNTTCQQAKHNSSSVQQTAAVQAKQVATYTSMLRAVAATSAVAAVLAPAAATQAT